MMPRSTTTIGCLLPVVPSLDWAEGMALNDGVWGCVWGGGGLEGMTCVLTINVQQCIKAPSGWDSSVDSKIVSHVGLCYWYVYAI